jgi:2-octaprenyl-6-methoxyphenol hydroxylase
LGPDKVLGQGADKHFDIIIVGGGLVGATLALALAGNRRVALLEAQVRPHPELSFPGGERAIVLSASSKNILTALDIWPVLEPYVEPVKEVQVTDRGHFGQVKISAKKEDLPALGYVIQAKYLQAQLVKLLDQHHNITVFYGAKCESLRIDDPTAVVKFNFSGEQKDIFAELIVAADGHQSALRELLGIAVNAVDYQQSAIVSNIDLARSHGHIAHERFTATGPVALLPLGDKKATLIWTLPHSAVKEILLLPTEEFTAKVQDIFGYRLGRFLKSTSPVAYPIVMQRSAELVRKRVVLVGNAANAIHPIAGQGLNLGLRDVAVLVELLDEKGFDQLENILCDYVARRRADHLQIVNITHSLVGFFTNAFFPLTLARNVGMTAMDCLPPVKRWLSKRSLGEVGYITPLACGVAVNYVE